MTCAIHSIGRSGYVIHVTGISEIIEASPTGSRRHAGLGDQRFRRSMGLAVSRNVTARANWGAGG